MTNTINRTTENLARNFATPAAANSDHAPMVLTRLSGWIDVGDAKSVTPTWIVPTRARNKN